MCESLKNNSEIYVHCIEMDEFISPLIGNLAAVRFNLAYGHISFAGNLEERRLLLFLATDDLDALCQLKSPVICEVKSSCLYNVRFFS